MAKVDTFTLQTTLYSDTRIPFQFRGNGLPAAPRGVELSVLLAWIEANISINGADPVSASITTGAPSVAIPAGKLLEKFVVIGAASGTFSLGTTVSGTDLFESEPYDTNGAVFVIEKYFKTAGNIYFSGFTGTLTVKLYYR